MLKKPIKSSKVTRKKVSITDDSGKKVFVGDYAQEKKMFYCKRKKSEHYMKLHKAWGLDSKVIDFLVAEGATIHLKDTEEGWEYEAPAIDFKVYGVQGQFKEYKSQFFLPLDRWKIVKVKNRACIVECLEIDCRFNFGNNCLNGSIKLGREGNCLNYEDKN